jgi:hypothetical protein
MVLANQNAKLTGPDQGFLVSRLILTLKPWERGWACDSVNPPFAFFDPKFGMAWGNFGIFEKYRVIPLALY